MVGRSWISQASDYEYRVDVTPSGSTPQITVAITLPEDIVYGRVFRNAKNFLALFVASAFLANLFLQLAVTLGRDQRLATSTQGDRGEGGGLPDALTRLGFEVGQALRSRGLLATIGFVGIPAKAVLTGVVVFARPLLMTGQGYRQEDIGQMLMIYAGSVILASSAIARVVDRSGRSGFVLGIGGISSGLGLLLIAFVDQATFGHGSYAETIETPLLALGIATVGSAHGLINAPIVTHVAELDLARRIGAASATAAYRFLERIGHVAGPILVSQLLVLSGQIGSVL